MHISSISTTRLGRRLLAATPLAIAVAAMFAACAHAAEGPQYGSIGQYGEVTRFGKFDSSAYDGDKYDKALTPGDFLNPVGFAVDTQDATAPDHTAIYVLDRVSDFATSTQGTQWRLQKLSDTGAPLATTEFDLPNDLVTEYQEAGYRDFVGATGLAVDDATGDVYTVLYNSTGEEAGATTYAEEVLEWSTTVPGSGQYSGQLVAPEQSTPDTVSTAVSGYGLPGVLSEASQLASDPSSYVYDPQGLALDGVDGQDGLALVGNGQPRTGNGTVQGPAIVQAVSTSDGADTGRWSAASLNGVTNASSADEKATAAGISSNPDGSLTVLLSTSHTGNKPLDAVDLPANPTLTGAPTVIDSESIDPSDSNADPLAVSERSGQTTVSGGGAASAQAVELSNGLYAADYYATDNQPLDYWNNSINEGIRLVSPESGGLLSNPLAPATSIFGTLADETQGDACYIGNENVANAYNEVSLAAGADGAVWVLTSGGDSSTSTQNAETGRQVIELAPGAARQCAEPSGTFSLTDTTASPSVTQTASPTSPLTVAVGHTVEFDASTIDYPTAGGSEALAYAYEWDPIGPISGEPGEDDYTLVEDAPSGPSSTASYQYKTPGIYTVYLKLLGDFGEYDEAGTVVVQTASPPTAAFTAPANAQTGQGVSFDASASQPAGGGAQIADYQWKFGDGQTDETQNPVDSHVYASPGTYTVTLIVHDNDERVSAPITQQITITSPPAGKGQEEAPPGGGVTGTPTTTSSVTPPPVATIDRSATNVSPTAVESGGNVIVTVSCPATKASCAGTAQVKTVGAIAAGTAKAAKAKKKKKAKKQVLVLGQKAFSLGGGQRETLTIKISSAGLALLKKDRTLKVDVLVAAHDSYGEPGSDTLALTLREPATKKTSGKK